MDNEIISACWIRGDGIDIAVAITDETTEGDILTAFREAEAEAIRAFRNGHE